jgi:dTDP-4-amino-4,6-dideoxygalactose transaminase
MDYQTFDPSTCGFPKPHVPVLPTLRPRSLRLRRQAAPHTLASSPNARFYTRGRYAMTDAYRLSDVGPASTLLAPAYHCRTMLDPAIRLGADVALYPLQANLAPDLDGLRSCLATCGKPPAALLLTHFFGFAQPLDDVIALCDAHGIALIEDCSHCLFLPHGQPGPGLRGRYTVASPYKFFPLEDCGTLWANQGAALPETATTTPGLMRELKGLARALQRATAPSRPLPNADTMTLPSPAELRAAAGADRASSMCGTSSQYQRESEHTRSLAVSRWALGHTDTQRLVARRRAHYQTWADAVAHLPHCQALLPALQPANAPYMFPLRLEHTATHFLALKLLGMPVWRWDDMAVSTCRVATDYRTHLVHLPCHQELTDGQMHWMTRTLARVMAMTPMQAVP